MTSMILLPEWLISTPKELPREAWGIRIQGGKIEDVASHADLKNKYPHDTVWEAPGQALAPGFVNAHTHLYGVLAHGIPLNKAPSGFWPFLEDFWWPLVEDHLDETMICAATALRCADMLLSGVTTFYDCTEAPNALPGILKAQGQVVARSGMRGILSFEATQRISHENGDLGLQENIDFIRECRTNASAAPLLRGAMCIHTTFTCDGDFIRQASQKAGELGVLLHAHVSEGTHEPEYTLQTFSLRPLLYYQELGVAQPGFLASQCVQVDPTEIELMANNGVSMVHMPLSNCEVGGGIAPVPDLIEAGVTVGLGSDGYIDDFFEVMRGAFLIHKAARHDPAVMPAHLVWELATEGGARALGFEKVGRLAPGWQADIQLIDLSTLPTPVETHNLFEQLLLYRSAKDVQAVWVEGNLRVRDGALLDFEINDLRNATHEAARRLWVMQDN